AQIAREQRIPLTFLAKIVSQLSSAGLLRATRGARGGVALARPADELSLLDNVVAIDGPLMLSDCNLSPDTFPVGSDCVVRVVWCEARAMLEQRLAETKFSDLVAASQPVPQV